MTRDRREKLGEYKTSQEEPDKAIKCFLLNKSRGKKKKRGKHNYWEAEMLSRG